MKRAIAVMALLLVPAALMAEGVIGVQTSVGFGAIVSDSDNVGSAAVGKIDSQFNISRYLSLGISAGQTGHFNQKDLPKAVKDANTNPQAFAGPRYYPHGDDVIVIHDADVDVDVTVNILPAVDPLPQRPVDVTEQNYWFAEPFISLGYPISAFGYDIIKPYAKGFYGASGMKSQDGEVRIGSSYGYGGGVAAFITDRWSISVEALSRKIETTRAIGYNHMQYVMNVGYRF